MSILSQPTLFSWENLDRSAPIVMIERILNALPDEALLRELHAERKGKRNDYPIAPLWRAVVAGALLGHVHVTDLVAELRRNAELREVCGFDPLAAERAVPADYVFSRLFAKLRKRQAQIQAMFEQTLERLGALLPDLGRRLAADSKALVVAGARPADADLGTKRYETVERDGSVRETTMSWFGYKLHLLIDAKYELPLAWEVTEASRADSPGLMPLVEHLEKKHPALHERAETLAADKGYDDGADKADLYDNHGIEPLIPPRDLWGKNEERRVKPLDEDRHDTIYYGPTGQVMCRIAPFETEPDKQFASMQFMGYEKGRRRLKFRCPAAAFGLTCHNRAACHCPPRVREGQWGRVVRVALERDRRLFLPVATHSRNFTRGYKSRTAVERVNARLDRVYRLEWALVRSRQQMALRVSLVMLAMAATAVAWIEANKPDNIRLMARAA